MSFICLCNFIKMLSFLFQKFIHNPTKITFVLHSRNSLRAETLKDTSSLYLCHVYTYTVHVIKLIYDNIVE